jgi:hypothetical protein
VRGERLGQGTINLLVAAILLQISRTQRTKEREREKDEESRIVAMARLLRGDDGEEKSQRESK